MLTVNNIRLLCSVFSLQKYLCNKTFYSNLQFSLLQNDEMASKRRNQKEEIVVESESSQRTTSEQESPKKKRQ